MEVLSDQATGVLSVKLAWVSEQCLLLELVITSVHETAKFSGITCGGQCVAEYFMEGFVMMIY